MKRNNNSEGRLSIISKTSKTSRKKSILAAEDSIVLKRKSPDELSIKSSNRDAKSDACSVDKNPRVISKLYLARDSIVLKISSNERKSLMVNIVERNNSEEKSVIIDADQEDNSEDENEVVVRKSKLVLASDSLEIIKSSGKLPTLPKPLKKHEQIKRKIKPKLVKKVKPKQIIKPRKPKPIGDLFTNEKILSLVDIMKQDQNLLRLFTACSK